MIDVIRIRRFTVSVVTFVALAGGRLPAADSLAFEMRDDRLSLKQRDQSIGDFVFRDAKILRPYFTNLRLANQKQLTRNHPPVTGTDAIDHADMHPGIWLAFGDISGNDFWRNQGRIEHVRFARPPRMEGDRLTFASENRLVSKSGDAMGRLDCDFTIEPRPNGWRLIWTARLIAESTDLVLGDQEEMGFGARVATGLTEKKGGVICNSKGDQTAKGTWGKPADWCDYSGTLGDAPGGITLMTAPSNFRESWWHNRDYGLFVANPFGRAAMKQGESSQVIVKPGTPLTLTFAAEFHAGFDYEPVREYEAFVRAVEKEAK